MGTMSVGHTLLSLCDAQGVRSIAVVGTAKNVGKTVVVATLCAALHSRRMQFGILSVGRDGEAIDVIDTMPKPRLRLPVETLAATARGALSPSPACEILAVSDAATALGQLTLIKIRSPAYVELVGPPSASAVQRVKRQLFELGAQRVILDGAIDRLAALAGESDAVIIATGASAAATIDATAEEAAGLVQRLQTPAFDPTQPFVRITGALDAERVAQLMRAGEHRQIVVADPTRIALHGHALTRAREALQIRCERPLRVVAAAVASIGRDRYFEPRALLRAVAEATRLPTFDTYADTQQQAA
ncbi:MAG: hypothetical protein JO233_08730 [Candidatus Eremiobacteraeota bacterium]|nr:hypothetical protein [Candidatus Eremiobacteraeota bacterium]